MSELSQQHERHLQARHRAERRFQLYGKLALGFAGLILVLVLGSIIFPGIKGLTRSEIRLEIKAEETVDSMQQLRRKSPIWTKHALLTLFPAAQQDVALRRQLYKVISPSAAAPAVMAAWREVAMGKPAMSGDVREVWVPSSDAVDMLMKGRVDVHAPEAERVLNNQQVAWVDELKKQGRVRRVFNTHFFSTGDSRNPVEAGFLSAVIGSLLTVFVCLALAFPLGVMTAVYLEEFAPQNRLRDIIDVNINNLAAVPSIVFGLLGLELYLNTMGMPRSAALAGGLTLALMVLPVIIITTRVALRAVPDSIRQAALGVGASPWQAVWHHVLPLSLPGIMTGTILAVARALGETAPLLMIGMVAFIVDIPHGFTDPATVMPVQIYIWASSPELGFVDKTAAGILVLIAILLTLNAVAIHVRKKFEQRW